MADENTLRQELEAAADEIVADPNTDASVLRWFYKWKTLEVIMANSRQHRENADSRAAFVPQPSSIVMSRGSGKTSRLISPARMAVVAAAAEVIAGRLFPTRTAEIYESMPEEVRKLIGGQEPKGNLSAMLTHAPMFKSHGRAGWVLAAPDERSDRSEGENGEVSISH